MPRKSLQTSPFLSLMMSAFLASCGGGSDGPATSPPPPPPPPPPAANAESVGGIWEGTTETEAPADVSTSFEADATAPFDIGVSPYTASFSAGSARTDTDTTLQNTGTFAWHIPASTTANITFESNPQTLSLFARNADTGVTSTIEILDDKGQVIATASPGDSFGEVTLAGTPGDSRIGSIRVTNSTGGGDVVIDDLTFGYLAEDGTIDCVVTEDGEYACTLRNAAANRLLGGVEGTLSVSGTQDVSGTGRRYAVLGTFLPNGTRGADLTVSSGMVTERTTLDLTMTASGLTTTATMTYDADYEKGSALENVEGNYIPNQSMLFGNQLDPYIIDTAGVVTAAFTTPDGLNCTVSGQVSIIDAAWNVYDVSMDLFDCGIRDGDYTGLGITRDVNGTNDRFAVRIFSDLNDITGFGGGNK